MSREQIYWELYAEMYHDLIAVFGENRSSRQAHIYAIQNTWDEYNEQKSI